MDKYGRLATEIRDISSQITDVTRNVSEPWFIIIIVVLKWALGQKVNHESFLMRTSKLFSQILNILIVIYQFQLQCGWLSIDIEQI